MSQKSLFFAIIIIILTSNILGVTRYVSKSGSNTPPFTSWESASNTIQSAIDISNHGDVIVIDIGFYEEAINITSRLTIIGTNADSVIIDGSQIRDRTIKVLANLDIQNVTIYGDKFGLDTQSINTKARCVNFVNCDRAFYSTKAKIELTSCNFLGCYNGSLIWHDEPDNLVHIENCIFYGKIVQASRALRIVYGEKVILRNNIVHGYWPGGFSMAFLKDVDITNNLFFNYWLLNAITNEETSEYMNIANNVVIGNHSGGFNCGSISVVSR